MYLAGRSHGSSSRSGIGWCDLPWDLASNSLEDIVDDIGDRKMFFQRRWAGRYIVMGTTRQTPCRFSGPALRYGEPVGKQALIQEARPDPKISGGWILRSPKQKFVVTAYFLAEYLMSPSWSRKRIPLVDHSDAYGFWIRRRAKSRSLALLADEVAKL